MSKVGVYIDGYNFYAGINHPGWLELGWCNFLRLAHRFASRPQDPSVVDVFVKYFTAKVNLGAEEKSPRESQRQAMWLEALTLETGGVEVPAHWVYQATPAALGIIFGRHVLRAGNERKEKQTDVNLAVHLVLDAAYNLYDRAIVVSADTDFTSAIESVRSMGKPISVRIPPNQNNRFRTAGFAGTPEEITRADLAACRLAESIPRKRGLPLRWSDYKALS